MYANYWSTNAAPQALPISHILAKAVTRNLFRVSLSFSLPPFPFFSFPHFEIAPQIQLKHSGPSPGRKRIFMYSERRACVLFLFNES